MNQVDFLILLVVAGCAIGGLRRGLIESVGDLLGILVGLAVGSVAYPLVESPLRWVFGLPPTIAGPLGVMTVAIAVVLLAGWGFSRLDARLPLRKPVSRAGGAVAGVLMGVLLSAVLVLASGLLPGAAEPVAHSALAPRIAGLVPRLHGTMDSAGLAMPRLVQFPADYQDEVAGTGTSVRFMRLNFARLAGATCLHCRSPVRFLGYRFSRGTLMSPKFQCPACDRTSDGCQTFEGFHVIYGKCPAVVAETGSQFDCGVWRNGWWTVPHGICPVCGHEYSGQPRPSTDIRPGAGLARRR